tara:strand:- start:316 stop:654 length:339 start_codon:yes stop_codon:yes gene_type:complete
VSLGVPPQGGATGRPGGKYANIFREGDEVMKFDFERTWKDDLADMRAGLAPKPVLYSRVMCRCCGGRTREVSPNEKFITMDFRQGIGVPFTRITSFRYLCDDCEVVTWRKNS